MNNIETNEEIFEKKLMSSYKMNLKQFKELDDYTKSKLIEGINILKNNLRVEKEDRSDEVIDDMEEFERSFVDSFGMTMDQFERLDFSEQEDLIDRVTKLNRKRENLLNLKRLFKHYPIFRKVNEKKFKKK